ncbi:MULTISPECIES: HlyD family type I secretion periplasmic adaptor subunit [Cupriavidus]
MKRVDHPLRMPAPGLAAASDDTRGHIRAGWLVIGAGVLGFLLWAAFAPLDKGVPVPGTVTVTGNRKTVQHPTGGIVEQILVRDGDTVKAGSTVIRMNDTQARARAEALRIQLATAQATESRLVAERDGTAQARYPDVLLAQRGQPAVAAALLLQDQLLASRRQALQGELAGLQETVGGMALQLDALREAKAQKVAQADALKEQLAGMRDLAREGYVARNRLLDLERLFAQVSGSLSEDIGRIGLMHKQILELKLRGATRREEYQKEVRTQLAETQLNAASLGSQLRAAEFDLANTLVKAPADGTVVGLNVFTAGGYVAAGAPLLDVLPAREPLRVEASVPVHLIDKLHPGLPVELMFVAFNQNRTPKLPGTVTLVSADRLVDDKTGTPYYRIEASVSPQAAAGLAGRQIRPGMPVEVFVKTGERSLMSYLLKPVLDRAHTALAEE